MKAQMWTRVLQNPDPQNQPEMLKDVANVVHVQGVSVIVCIPVALMSQEEIHSIDSPHLPQIC